VRSAASAAIDAMMGGVKAKPPSLLRVALRALLSLVFAGVGVAHFTHAERFVAIMPPYLPWHLELVWISGVFEIAGAIGLWIPRLRPLTGWCLIALLVAVWPANLQHALDPPPGADLGVFGWVRLAFQPVFMLWAWWVSRPDAAPSS